MDTDKSRMNKRRRMNNSIQENITNVLGSKDKNYDIVLQQFLLRIEKEAKNVLKQEGSLNEYRTIKNNNNKYDKISLGKYPRHLDSNYLHIIQNEVYKNDSIYFWQKIFFENKQVSYLWTKIYSFFGIKDKINLLLFYRLCEYLLVIDFEHSNWRELCAFYRDNYQLLETSFCKIGEKIKLDKNIFGSIIEETELDLDQFFDFEKILQVDSQVLDFEYNIAMKQSKSKDYSIGVNK